MELIQGQNHLNIKNFQDIMDELSTTSDRLPRNTNVTTQEFTTCVDKHPALVAAMLRLQLAMRKDFLGEVFWQKLTKFKYNDKHLVDPEFVIKLNKEFTHRTHEKNAKLKMEERAKRMGNERNALKGVYVDHETASKEMMLRKSVANITFDANKAVPLNFNIYEDKKKKKQELDNLIQDDMALEIANSRNSPEKLSILVNHEFRYTSDGMGVATVGNWNPSPRSKPPVNRNSPSSPRTVLPVLDGKGKHSRVLAENGRPNSRGNSESGASPRLKGQRRPQSSEGQSPRSSGSPRSKGQRRPQFSEGRPSSSNSGSRSSPQGSPRYHHCQRDSNSRPNSPLNATRITGDEDVTWHY